MAISVAVAVARRGRQQIERLTPRVKALVVDRHARREMGPLVTSQHRNKVGHRGRRRPGATLVVDGRSLTVPGNEKASSWAARCSTTCPP